MIMQLRIPDSHIVKAYDTLLDLAKPFAIDLQHDIDDVVIEGDESEIFDFLTAYHDIDVTAAKNDIEKYIVKNSKQFKRSYTPEAALERLNDFVLSKGAFNDYDAVFEALSNAIHGID